MAEILAKFAQLAKIDLRPNLPICLRISQILPRQVCPVGTYFGRYVGGVVRLKIKIFVKLCHPHSQLKLEIKNSDSLPVFMSRINCSACCVYQAVGLPVESFWRDNLDRIM